MLQGACQTAITSRGWQSKKVKASPVADVASNQTARSNGETAQRRRPYKFLRMQPRLRVSSYSRTRNRYEALQRHCAVEPLCGALAQHAGNGRTKISCDIKIQDATLPQVSSARCA